MRRRKLADPVAGTLCDPAAGAGDPLQCDQRFGDESAIVPYSADRKAYALFGELVVPVTKNLEVTASVRYDHYSDFGNATTAKGSFRFTPMKNLLIRGSIGTGFHAPTVPQVNASQQPFGVTNDDYTCTPELQQLATALNAQCQPGSKQYDVITGGNLKLKPEKSKQASLGLRFDPVPEVSLGADLWHVNIRDSFGQVAETELFGKPLQYPTAWATKTDTGTGVVYLASLQSNVNLGREYYTGLDLDFVGRTKTDFGEPDVAVGHDVHDPRAAPGGARRSVLQRDRQPCRTGRRHLPLEGQVDQHLGHRQLDAHLWRELPVRLQGCGDRRSRCSMPTGPSPARKTSVST